MEATLTIKASDTDEQLVSHISRSKGMTDREFLELLLNEALAHVLFNHRQKVVHELLLGEKNDELDAILVAKSGELTKAPTW